MLNMPTVPPLKNLNAIKQKNWNFELIGLQALNLPTVSH